MLCPSPSDGHSVPHQVKIKEVWDTDSEKVFYPEGWEKTDRISEPQCGSKAHPQKTLASSSVKSEMHVKCIKEAQDSQENSKGHIKKQKYGQTKELDSNTKAEKHNPVSQENSSETVTKTESSDNPIEKMNDDQIDQESSLKVKNESLKDVAHRNETFVKQVRVTLKENSVEKEGAIKSIFSKLFGRK